MEIGKSKADKFIIWIFQLTIYCTLRYCKLLIRNYDKFRLKSSVPGLAKINFKTTVYPFAFYGILLPTTLGYIVQIFTPEDIFRVIVIIYFSLLAIIITLAFFYFISRISIDFLVSGFCFVKSIIVTTIYSIKSFVRFVKESTQNPQT